MTITKIDDTHWKEEYTGNVIHNIDVVKENIANLELELKAQRDLLAALN